MIRATAGRARLERALPVLGLVLGAGIPLAFVGIFFAWPLLGMLGLGFAPGGALDLSGVGDVLSRGRTLRVVLQTVAQAGAATVLSVVIGLPLASVLHRRRFRGRGILRALVTVPFVMPTVVVGLAFRLLFREGGPLGALQLDSTPMAVVIALAFFNIAVVVRTVGAAWEGLDPRQEQAAAALGATPWRVLRTVTLPRLAPSLLGAAAIVFLFCATSFGVVLVVGGPGVGTLETEIYRQTMDFLDLRAASVLSLLQLVMVLAALGVAARFRRRSETAQRRTGWRDAVRPATRRDAPALVFAVVVAALLMLPLLQLALRSLRVGDAWSLDHYAALTTSAGGSTLGVTALDALGNSLVLGAAATILSLVLGLSLALVLSRRTRSRASATAREALDRVVMLPLGVSAVTIGLGILITLNAPPLDLRSSPILVPIAQALVALPLVVRVLLPVLRGVDDRQRDAARALGAAPWRVLRDVDLAVAARPLLAAAGFAFAVSLGEFGATAFLSRPDRPTLPVLIYRLVSTPAPGSLEQAVAASVLLAALTVVVMALVERTRVGRVGMF